MLIYGAEGLEFESRLGSASDWKTVHSAVNGYLFLNHGRIRRQTEEWAMPCICCA